MLLDLHCLRHAWDASKVMSYLSEVNQAWIKIPPLFSGGLGLPAVTTTDSRIFFLVVFFLFVVF